MTVQQPLQQPVGRRRCFGHQRPDPLAPQPAHPDALAVGVAVDGHIAAAGREAFLAGPVVHGGDVVALQRPDAQEGGHRNLAATARAQIPQC